MPSDKVGTGSVRKAFIGDRAPGRGVRPGAITGYTVGVRLRLARGRDRRRDRRVQEHPVRLVHQRKIFAGGGAAGTTGYKNNGANFDVYARCSSLTNAYGVCPLSGNAMQHLREGARLCRLGRPAGAAFHRRLEGHDHDQDPQREHILDVLKSSVIDTHVKGEDDKMHPVQIPRYSFTSEAL
jgi:hypothetical protein